MWFNEFNPSVEEVKDISEKKTSDSLENLKSEINSQIKDSELKNQATEELEEFKAQLDKNKDAILGVDKENIQSETSVVLENLKEDLIEDLDALNNIEDKFWSMEWFDIFKRVLLSNEITQQQREWLYDLVQSWEAEKYVTKKLKWNLFPDVESLNTFINKSKKRWKIETSKKWEDSDILEMRELELSDLTLSELQYFKWKIKWLLGISSNFDKTVLNNKNIEIDNLINSENKKELVTLWEEVVETWEEVVETWEEVVETWEEVVETWEEVVETWEEVVETWEEVEGYNEILKSGKEEFSDFVLDLVNNWSIKDNTWNLKEKLKEYKNAKWEKFKELNSEILELIKSPDVIKQILNQAQIDWSYDKVYNFLDALAKTTSKWWKELSQILEIYSGEGFISGWEKVNEGSLPRYKEAENYLWKSKWIDRNWDTYIFWDKMVDFTNRPPEAYIFSENWYKLESEMQWMQNTAEIIKMRRELQKIKLDYKDLSKSLSIKEHRLEELNNIPENERTQKQKEEITKLEQEINNIHNKIAELVGRANDIKEFFDTVELFDQEEKQRLKEKEEHQRDILKYLNAIWFDLIPQSVTNQFIRELQSNQLSVPGLNLSSVQNIDLNEGKFWELENEANWDKWKDNLLNFTEKMIYWEINPEWSIFRWQSFKWEMAASINPVEFYGVLDKQWLRSNSWWNINTLRKNLKKEEKK